MTVLNLPGAIILQSRQVPSSYSARVFLQSKLSNEEFKSLGASRHSKKNPRNLKTSSRPSEFKAFMALLSQDRSTLPIFIRILSRYFQGVSVPLESSNF